MVLTPLEDQITEAVERLSHSVVSVNSTRLARDFRFGIVPMKGVGTGVIIDERGYIVTNYHVIDDADKVEIDLEDGRTFIGDVIGETQLQI